MMQTIYVGDKAPIKYATAVAMEFERGNNEVCIKARGKAISTAVDASQISINKFVKDAKIKEIKIFTEEIENKYVSAIEILLSKE